MRTALFVILAASVSVSGCATGGPAGSGQAGTQETGGPDHISSEELRQIDADNLTARQAIQRLRGNWLRSRGSSFSGGRDAPKVFVDGIEYGDLGSLNSIAITDVEEMRYLDASDATTRFGTGYAGGAILVTTR